MHHVSSNQMHMILTSLQIETNYNVILFIFLQNKIDIVSHHFHDKIAQSKHEYSVKETIMTLHFISSNVYNNNCEFHLETFQQEFR